MIRIIIILMFISVLRINTIAQDSTYRAIKIGISSGFGKVVTSDRLLNSFVYNGNTKFPAKLDLTCLKNKNLYNLTLSFISSEIKPSSYYEAYYNYNYLTHYNYNLDLNYERNLGQIKDKLSIFVGVNYNLNFTLQEENYSSLLYENGQGYKKSFTLSVLSISPKFMSKWFINDKNSMQLEGTYYLFCLAARPSDDYVKQQTNSSENYYSKLYGINTYLAYQFAFNYKRQIFPGLDIKIEYSNTYKHYRYEDECRYLSNLILLGIEKTF